jgi:hypothetical protein
MSAFTSACALCGGQYLGPPLVPDADPGVDHTQFAAGVSPEFRRTAVYYRAEYPQGTIIVNTADRFLYLITGNNVALRYGIGVGRAGFQWGGIHVITRKAEWPDWRPPPEMIGCFGAMSQRPLSAVPSSAAKQAGESKRGQHSQSIQPSRPTKAAVRQSPISA